MINTQQALTPHNILNLIGTLSEELTRREQLLATAESCTGGLIAAMCTDIPGSSSWFAGGVVAYANHVKERALGVPAAILADHGAVSEPVVRHMALGALSTCGAQTSIAVSGVAGPGGGTPEKPVGTVCIGWAVVGHYNEKYLNQPGTCEHFPFIVPGGILPAAQIPATASVCVCTHTFQFNGDRSTIRMATVREGLTGLLRLLQ